MVPVRWKKAQGSPLHGPPEETNSGSIALVVRLRTNGSPLNPDPLAPPDRVLPCVVFIWPSTVKSLKPPVPAPDP